MFRYLIILICCIHLQVVAQEAKKGNHNKAAASYEKANALLQKGQFREAVDLLSKSVNDDPDFVKSHQQLADIYRKEGKYKKACRHYAEVMRINPNISPYSHFGYGESLLLTGEYVGALAQLDLFLQQKNTTPQSIIKAKKYKQDCLFSIKNKQNPFPIQLKDLGSNINTDADEYFPMLTADGNSIIFTRKDDQENFFESRYFEEHGWENAVPLSETINTAHFNEGAHTLSADGNYLFFTGCNRPDGLGSCDIYVSKRENGSWSPPFRLDRPINSSTWDAQPAISADGKTIYFVSNRKGGYGGTDIWKSTLTDRGEWGAAENLGPNINTSYNESSPSIHADNETLYFSSDGWPGFGQNDLFVSKRNKDGEWNVPTNLGYPINDHAEQRSIFVNFNGDTAYLATRTPKSTTGLDIFKFSLPKPFRPNPVTYVKGIISDEQTGKRLPAHIILTRLSDKRNVLNDHADITNGTFLAPLPFGYQYALQITHPGYLFYSGHYALLDSALISNTYDIDIKLKPIAKGKTAALNNVFFPVDQFEILPQSQTDLALLLDFLNVNKSVKIEISGHTDNSGSAVYNQQLSEKRAKSVYDYLIEHHIDPDRLSYHGYGQEQPIGNNDTLEGRALNRRTEFKIIETY